MAAMSQLMLDIFGTPPLGPVYLLTIFDLDVVAKPARVTSWKKAYLFRQLHASPASRTDYPTGAKTHSWGAARLDEYLEQMRSGLSTLNPTPGGLACALRSRRHRRYCPSRAFDTTGWVN